MDKKELAMFNGNLAKQMRNTLQQLMRMVLQ
jgi:hypothetical protein